MAAPSDNTWLTVFGGYMTCTTTRRGSYQRCEVKDERTKVMKDDLGV